MWQKKHQIFHPTIKNVECLAWLIEISSNPGDLVFDGFMGTGSTALAALETNRTFWERRFFRPIGRWRSSALLHGTKQTHIPPQRRTSDYETRSYEQ